MGHQSVDELASGEGKYWRKVCSQQVVSEEQFQHHLVTHLLTFMDKPGPDLSSDPGANGRKELHVFLSVVGTGDNACSNLKEGTSSDSSVGNRCNVCEKVLSSARSLKRHMYLIHSKGKLKKISPVNVNESGIVVTGPVQNKHFDFCEGVITSKVHGDPLETSGEGFAMNDEKSHPPEEEKGCEIVKTKSMEIAPKKNSCRICDMTFSTHARVQTHLASLHFKEKIMQEMTSDLNCALCDRDFKRNSELVIHVGYKHSRSEIYLKEYMDVKLQTDQRYEQLSESDVLISSFEDEINSSALVVESEEILTFFAQP